MMLKEKSNPWARLKYLYVLPLAAVAVTAFARPEISEKAEEISAVKVNDLAEFMQVNVPRDTVKVKHGTVNTMQTVKRGVNEVTTNEAKGNEEMVVFDVVEKMPEFPGGLSALNKYLEDKVNSSSLKGKTGGSVIIEFTVSENGKVKDVKATQSDHSDLTKEAEKIVSEMPDWAPGQQRGMSVPVKYSVPVRFGNIRFTEGKKPLVLVDGKEVEHDALEKMNQDVIESFTILKDSSAVAVYGSRGADGVILIKTKEPDKTKSTEAVTVVVTKDGSRTEVSTNIKVKGTVVDEQGRPKRGVSVVVANSSTGTLTDADGRFHLNAPQDGILWFSFVGYKTVKVPASSDMSIRMEQEVVKLFPEKTGTFKITTRASGVEGPSGMFALHGQ